MKKIKITERVELQVNESVSPKRGRLIIDGLGTYARFSSDESEEEVIFVITSSSPITNCDEAASIAKECLTIMNK